MGFFFTECFADTVAFWVWVAVVVVFAVVFDVSSFIVVTVVEVVGSDAATGSGVLLGSTKNLKWFQHFPCRWWTMT